MRDEVIRATGLAAAVAYAAVIGWLYASQPQSLDEVGTNLSVTLRTYEVDARAFDDGLRFFRQDQFVEARAAFDRADPARRDPRTQFYVAYSYYRQGWGRLSSDDDLYRAGLERVDRAIAQAPGGRVVVEDADLGMRSADELRAELEAGLTVEASDFNPLRVLRTRK